MTLASSFTNASAAGLSATLAAFVANTGYGDLDQGAIAKTRHALLDGLGVSIAAGGLGEGVRSFVEWVKAQQASGPCSVLGENFSTSASLAAFANGAMAHALDFEDAHDRALVHPNAAVIPAVLAVAQTLPRVSGRAILTAIAVGCEITCRLGMTVAVRLDQLGWYPPPILSAYGATAAVANLLGLNQAQVLDAFSLTLSQATCSAEIKHNPGSAIRAIRDAFPAQTGVVSAQLAARGVAGFAEPLEGKDGFFAGFAQGEYQPSLLVDNLGYSFAVSELSFKPWPSCRGTHVPVELTLELCREHGLTADDVESITVYSNGLNRMLAEPLASKQSPSTAIDAKFSIPFCVATAATNRELNLASFFPDALTNAAVRDVASRVIYRVDDSYHSPLQARVVITTRDGRSLSAEADNAPGCPARPLSEARLVEKFRHCLCHSRSTTQQQQAGTLASLILTLDQLDDLQPFFELL